MDLTFGTSLNQSVARLGRVQRYTLDVLVQDTEYDPEQLIGQPVSLAILLGRDAGGQAVMEQMQRCAEPQRYAGAARDLAGYFCVSGEYAEAVKFYQQGVRLGDLAPARRLAEALKGPSSPEDLYYLNLKPDPDRSSRCTAIAKLPRSNETLNSKTKEPDSIVPLPSANVPAWDNTLQWENDLTIKASPKKPEDNLIQHLSKKKLRHPRKPNLIINLSHTTH
ncbi:DUF6396 domain-containing protein [Pseudomonas viridiflava]|uniref:DUF6396 domain-containing protein n=1 Tax=Pseudomonas viridiflava TaxID=33069 RepID=UPI001C7E4B74|nr:DUF6396 domain-containing protein [Pseudomonas viridiflava]